MLFGLLPKFETKTAYPLLILDDVPHCSSLAHMHCFLIKRVEVTFLSQGPKKTLNSRIRQTLDFPWYQRSPQLVAGTVAWFLMAVTKKVTTPLFMTI